MRPEPQVSEPSRTERLLRAPLGPFALFSANAADTLDAIGFSLMARSSGDSLAGVCFESLILSGQLLVGAISGISGAFEAGGGVVALAMCCTVQLSIGLGILRRSPSADRLMSLLLGMQFTLEGSATLLVLHNTLYPTSAHTAAAERATVYLALMSLFGPVLSRIYDALIVQISKAVRSDGFTCKAACFACIGVVVFLPTVVAQLLGIDLLGDASAKDNVKLAEAVVDKMGAMADVVHNDETVRHIEASPLEIPCQRQPLIC